MPYLNWTGHDRRCCHAVDAGIGVRQRCCQTVSRRLPDRPRLRADSHHAVSEPDSCLHWKLTVRAYRRSDLAAPSDVSLGRPKRYRRVLHCHDLIGDSIVAR